MMLCPKCGKEYEGQECPFCSGPKILVNQNDYMKRKMAYEKKQAEKRSASSRTQETVTDIDPDQLVQNIKSGSVKGIQIVSGKAKKLHKNLTGNKKKSKNNHNSAQQTEQDVQGGILYTTRKAGKGDGMNRSGRGLAGIWRRHRKLWIALLILVVVAGLSAVGIYQLVIRKNYVLYMTSNGKIYDVANLESQYVCDESDAIFEVNRTSFYTPGYPSDVEVSEIKDKMASENGKYFSCVTYDADTQLYTMYLWNDTQEYKVSSNKKEKSIKYVTDKGVVIYTDANVINEEGAISGVEYYIYDASDSKSEQGTLSKFADNLNDVYLYSDSNVMICLDSSDQLFLYNYKDMSKTSLDIEVSTVYALSSDYSGVYTNKADFANTQDGADTFFYSTDGGCYYYDISENTTMYVCKNVNAQAQFISEKQTQIYLIQSGVLSYATVNSSKVSSFTEVDTLGSDISFVTTPQNTSILYINASGNLCSATKGSSKVITEGVTDGSLAVVGNTDEAFTYWKNEIQYYQKNSAAKAVEMTTAVEQSEDSEDEEDEKLLEQVIYYKNKLYFYDINGKLHSCSIKGGSNDLIGEVDSFWLGSELK